MVCKIKDCLSAPLMLIKIVFYMHAILSVGILMSAGSTGIATPHLFYSLIFLGSLVWITEGLDKVKSINHAHVFNIIGLACEIAFLCNTPRGHGFNRGWNTAFLIISLVIRPISMILLHCERRKWVPSAPIIIHPTINNITNNGNFENNIKIANTDIHFGPPHHHKHHHHHHHKEDSNIPTIPTIPTIPEIHSQY